MSTIRLCAGCLLALLVAGGSGGVAAADTMKSIENVLQTRQDKLFALVDEHFPGLVTRMLEAQTDEDKAAVCQDVFASMGGKGSRDEKLKGLERLMQASRASMHIKNLDEKDGVLANPRLAALTNARARLAKIGFMTTPSTWKEGAPLSDDDKFKQMYGSLYLEAAGYTPEVRRDIAHGNLFGQMVPGIDLRTMLARSDLEAVKPSIQPLMQEKDFTVDVATLEKALNDPEKKDATWKLLARLGFTSVHDVPKLAARISERMAEMSTGSAQSKEKVESVRAAFKTDVGVLIRLTSNKRYDAVATKALHNLFQDDEASSIAIRLNGLLSSDDPVLKDRVIKMVEYLRCLNSPRPKKTNHCRLETPP